MASYPFARAPRLRTSGAPLAPTDEVVNATVDRLAAPSLADRVARGECFGVAISKWVGGKREQLNVYDTLWPADVGDRVLIDPTMGAASIFFHLAPRLTRGALIADVNPALVNAARVVKLDLPALIEALTGHAANYDRACGIDRSRGATASTVGAVNLESASVYYAIRDIQRNRGSDFGLHPADAYSGTCLPPEVVSDAAIFFMLIWLSFNGLWRVNRHGQHNGPHDHTKTSISLLSKLNNLKACNRILNAVQTDIRLISDFSDPTDEILQLDSSCKAAGGAGAFVYTDPPYAPIKDDKSDGGRSFTSYAKDGFDSVDQIRLRDFNLFLDSNGVKIMTSNSDCPETRGLYTGEPFNITATFGSRRVNRDANARGLAEEIVVRNYR